MRVVDESIGVVDENMGVVDENIGVVDESMRVVDENLGVVDRTAVGVVDGSSMMMISSWPRKMDEKYSTERILMNL